MAHDQPAQDHGPVKGAVLLFLLAAVVSLAALIYRRPDAFTMPWFYGEEGRQFMADAYNVGWASLFHTANGYFHLYPRLIANLGLSLGLSVTAMPWLNLAAELLLYLAVWAYGWSRFPGPAVLRFLAVLTITLVPLGNEIWMNQTNLQWPMSLLIPLILFGRPAKSDRLRWLDGLLLILACTTGPYALVLLPLIGWQGWRIARSTDPTIRSGLPYFAIAIAAATLCALSLARHGNLERTDGVFTLTDPGFVRVAFAQLWFPLIGINVVHTPFWAQVVLLMVGASGLVVLWLRSRTAPPLVRILIAMAVLEFVAVLVSYRGAPGFLSPYTAGIRNFYLPVVLITWAFLVQLNGQRGVPVWVAGALMIWWLVQTMLYVGPQRFRERPVSVDLSPLSRGNAVELPIDPPGWVMRLEPRQ